MHPATAPPLPWRDRVSRLHAALREGGVTVILSKCVQVKHALTVRANHLPKHVTEALALMTSPSLASRIGTPPPSISLRTRCGMFSVSAPVLTMWLIWTVFWGILGHFWVVSIFGLDGSQAQNELGADMISLMGFDSGGMRSPVPACI